MQVTKLKTNLHIQNADYSAYQQITSRGTQQKFKKIALNFYKLYKMPIKLPTLGFWKALLIDG